MQKHEEYESLVAQSLIGELSPEEHADLVTHMRVCEPCCRTAREFLDVMQHLPIEASETSCQDIRELEEDARLQHFISRAKEEGVAFSSEALKTESPMRWWRRIISVPTFVIAPAIATLIVAIAGLALLAYRYDLSLVNSSSALLVPTPPPPILQFNRGNDAAGSDTKSALNSAQQKIAELKSELEANDNERVLANAEVQRLEEALTELKARYSQEEQELPQLAATASKSDAERDRAVASLVADETRLRDLESKLSNAREAVEQERELNAAAHDVRELMGARNLHIIDVYDSNNHSRTDRSFGRVMYEEGKSLIFYAFDLDKAHNVKKVSFHAWGEREGEHRDAKKLGVFYVDDAAQKRWVLKVNDPDKLKSIDTVFVTVESHRDTEVPNHQRLLQAYLGSTANHP